MDASFDEIVNLVFKAQHVPRTQPTNAAELRDVIHAYESVGVVLTAQDTIRQLEEMRKKSTKGN